MERRRAGKARIGQEGADLEVGVVPRLDEAEELEDEPLAQHDRGVRLLDAERTRCHVHRRIGGLCRCPGGADELGAAGGDRRAAEHRGGQVGCPGRALGHEVPLGGSVGGEAHLDDGERGIGRDGDPIDLDDRGDGEVLRPEPARGDDLLGRHPDPSSLQSRRNRTIGQGTSPRIQW